MPQEDPNEQGLDSTPDVDKTLYQSEEDVAASVELSIPQHVRQHASAPTAAGYVLTEPLGRSLRETCVEELLPEGTQDKPVWFGREVGEHMGLAEQLEKTMEDSNGKPFVLQLYDGKVRVVGAGPDGRMGTKDDDVYPADLKGEAWVFDKRPRQPER